MGRIILVCHDAGGAELVSRWAKKNGESTYSLVAGPAVEIFKRNLPETSILTKEADITTEDKVVTGTSWQSSLEKRAIFRCQQLGIECTSILDHWINYLDRFMYNDELVLPGTIWVCDSHAHKIACDLFTETKIQLIENPYLESIRVEIARIRFGLHCKGDEENQRVALYVNENINSHSIRQTGHKKGLTGYTEEDAFCYFLEKILKVEPRLTRVIVRPHPSQEPRDLLWMERYKQKSQLCIEMSNGSTLLEQIMHCEIVAGAESMALVVAMEAGKTVVSCIPEEGRPCSLPFKEIIHLREIT